MIRRFASFGAIFLVVIVVEVIAIFAILLYLNVWLGLLTIFTAIPVLILCRRFERNFHVVVRDIQDQTGDLTTMIEEAHAASACSSRLVGATRCSTGTTPAASS